MGNSTPEPRAVYPRWRGEHVQCWDLKRVALRFIPAGAGNTVSVAPSRYAVTVYPRWRGEHSQAQHDQQLVAGLSPLTRGTRVFN